MQAAEDFCQQQIAQGTPAASAIDVEYQSSNGCANGNTPVGGVTYNGITFPTDCNDPSSYSYSILHCYGITNWNGSVKGSYTVIPSIPLLFEGDSHVNTEMWLDGVAPNGYDCPVDGQDGTDCWVETGVKAGPSQCPQSECLFWDDVRPCQNCTGGNNYNKHFITTVNVNDIGAPLALQIYQSASNQYKIFDDIIGVNTYTNWSNDNITPSNLINVGAEVQGTTGGQIPSTDFTTNEWEDSSNNWHVQSGTGQAPSVDSPVSAKWVVTPSPNGSGGDWNVSCGC